MDTQNVSAQLYFKQMAPDPASGSFNCEDTYPNLSTCVQPVPTDAQIENAFQKQLNLSEYYKSPEVFDTVKKNYTDQTMEREPPAKPQPAPPNPPAVPENVPVGPNDFLRRFIKEGFGMGPWYKTWWIWLLISVGVIMIIMGIYFTMKKRSSPAPAAVEAVAEVVEKAATAFGKLFR
jgi:hypothetical protein